MEDDAPKEKEGSGPAMWEAFKTFIAKNPTICNEFYETVETLWKRGFRRYSAHAILGYLRFQRDLGLIVSTSTPGTGTEFKIANGHAAFFARRFLDCFPERDGLFVLHDSVSDPFFPELMIRVGREHRIHLIPTSSLAKPT